MSYRSQPEQRVIPCTQCGETVTASGHQLANWKKSGRIYCGPECVRAMKQAAGAKRRGRRPEPPCTVCGSTVKLSEQSKSRLDMWTSAGRAYCSDTCRDAWVQQDVSERMARTNRTHASDRMRRDNPMHSAEVRERMSGTLKRIGHRPPQRGGNGSGLTEPQRRLAEFLGWETETVIVPRDGEMPWHYRVDIAHPTMKVAVEVDGGSHFSLERQASDRRKDERLSALGWLVLRFSNRDAMERTAECARTVTSTTSKWTPRTPT